MIERQRPIVDGRETRWRWWLMRVDEERCVFRFVEDYERYDFACLMADGAVVVCGGHFVIFDGEKREATSYDSRKLVAKFPVEEPPTRPERAKDEAPQSG